MKKKGISLITLVITIVVVIILAAAVIISISNNNPISQAKEARDKSNEVTYEEELKLKQMHSILLEEWNGTTATSFAGGDGSKNNPYLVSNGAELAYFADTVNGGDTYEGKYVKLTKSINLGNKEFRVIGNSNLEGYHSDGTDITKEFNGTFDGDGNVITGLVINKQSYAYVGLFGVLGESGIIQNLNIFQGNVTGYITVGGIVGFNKGKVLNCTNAASILSTNGQTGGIVGRSSLGEINNCTNYGNVAFNFYNGTYSPIVGGIVARSNNSNIDNCKNYGNISSSGKQMGGIVGSFNNGKIAYCYNYGTLNINENARTATYPAIGGIVGGIGSNSIVNYVYNSGDIIVYETTENANKIGGIVGMIQTSSGNVKYTYNKGNIVAKLIDITGGIVGSQTIQLLEKCYYYGELPNVIGADSSSTAVTDDDGKAEHIEDNINSYQEFLIWIKNK